MTEILVADFIKGILIFLRILAAIYTAPVFRNKSVPKLAITFLALLITYIAFFFVDDVDYNVDQGLIYLGLIGIKEVITGIIIGFMLNFVFYALGYAGMLMGYDMGLGAAMGFDPSSESNSNIIGQVFSVTGILIFILINGHHYVIRGLSYSFEVIPIGFYTINGEVTNLMIQYSASIFILAVKIASPLMVSFFLLHIAAGIVARISPQMNVFFVIQPLKMGLGFFLLISAMPLYVVIIRNLLMEYEDKLFELLKAMSV